MNKERYLSALGWLVASALVLIAVYLGWRRFQGNPFVLTEQVSVLQGTSPDLSIRQAADTADLRMPDFTSFSPDAAVQRKPLLRTSIPKRPKLEIKPYTVSTGDSVFEIAAKFNIKPETVLWANYDQLNDNPDMISLGMQLLIPPVDGVLHKWKAEDTLQGVADQYEASPVDILSFPGNQIDLVEQQVAADALVLVPGGEREFRQWIIPTIPRGRAGVSRSVYGEGACEGSYDGAYGSGAFVWPAGNHVLSGNDYWSGHLGIDIAAGEGATVYAADSGVVVFSGWSTGGYGNTIIIDHGNGYQTLYGHLSNPTARCGQSVGQGNTIGYAGGTGNSTGAHLHFEVRYQGGFISPWYVLPAP